MRGTFCHFLFLGAVVVLTGCATFSADPEKGSAEQADNRLVDRRLASMEERMIRIERNLGMGSSRSPAADTVSEQEAPGLSSSSGPGLAAALSVSPSPSPPSGLSPVSDPVRGEGAAAASAARGEQSVNDALKDLSVSFANPLAGGPAASAPSPALGPSSATSPVSQPVRLASSRPVAPPPAVTPAPLDMPVTATPPGAADRVSRRSSAVVSKDGTPAYDAALSIYYKGEYERAGQAFREFLRQYPQSSLVPNALYWQGECLYSLGKYDAAILAFKDVAGKYPTHSKAAASLLKAGFSYLEMKDKENARFYFQLLLDDFPDSEPARLARGRLAAL